MSRAPATLVPAPDARPGPIPEAAVQASLADDLSELAKTRLTLLVLLTTLAGYGLAARGPFDGGRLFHTLLGTLLVAVCSSILNQALERDTDALMRRTERRPLVTGRLPLVGTVLAGLGLGIAGLAELACFVNGAAAALAALTLAIYVLAYTPLKRATVWNTLVGTIPGALPPLLGATAAQGGWTVEGGCLFALLAVWQLPHFYAIAWLYREDYRAAGLRMISVDDRDGRRTATHALVSALVLFPVSLLPVALGVSGYFYGGVAALLSALFVGLAWRFRRAPDRVTARRLFLGSIIYLPLILIVLGLDALRR